MILLWFEFLFLVIFLERMWLKHLKRWKTWDWKSHICQLQFLNLLWSVLVFWLSELKEVMATMEATIDTVINSGINLYITESPEEPGWSKRRTLIPETQCSDLWNLLRNRYAHHAHQWWSYKTDVILHAHES